MIATLHKLLETSRPGAIPQRQSIVDTVNRDVYGFLTNDTDTDLRIKCLAACLISSFVVALRMCSRVVLMLQGNSFQNAREKAQLLWHRERYECYLAQQVQAMPNRQDLEERVSYEQAVQLIKDIAKVVTYPLAWLALEFSALFGVVFPIYGRYFFTSIEQLYSVKFMPETDLVLQSDQVRICNYMAPCFLPLRIFEKENLFSVYPTWDSRLIKSLCLRARNLYSEYAFYFSPELGEKLEACEHFIQEKGISNWIDRRGLNFRHPNSSPYSLLHKNLDSLPGLMLGIIEEKQILVSQEELGQNPDLSYLKLRELEENLRSNFLQADFAL